MASNVSRSIMLPSDQVDGATGIKLSSDQVFDHVCGPCKVEGKENEARKYCEECAKYVCHSCVNAHQKFSTMKKHKIVDVAARVHVLLGRQVLSHRKVNVRLADDKCAPYITGCGFMPNRNLIMCDYDNKKIKLFDGSCLKLSYYPNDVSVIDAATVIVTLPYVRQLQFVQVFPQLKLNRLIQLYKKCWGVSVSGQEIYVSCHNSYRANDGEVRVLDKQGHLKRRLGIRRIRSNLFRFPSYITVNTTGDKILVSDVDRSIVICMKVDGSKVYQYKDADLKWPRDLYCDDGDNVIVCDYVSNNIHVITSDGKKYGILLSSQGRLNGPSCVAYRNSDDTLVVGCYRNDYLFVYQLSK